MASQKISASLGVMRGAVNVMDGFLSENPSNYDGTNPVHDSLNEALNHAAEHGIGDVRFTRAGIFSITETVIVPKNVLLTLGPRTRIKVSADVDGIQIAGATSDATNASHRSGLQGGTIWHTSNSQTKALVLFDGSYSATGVAPFPRLSQVGIWNTCLRGNSNSDPDGIGIHLKAVGVGTTRSVVSWLRVHGITFSQLDTAIWLECMENNSTLECYANGNQFSDISMEYCRRNVRMTANFTGTGVPAITGNQFTNVTAQSSATQTGQKWLVADGNYTAGIKGNSFVNYYPYDGSATPSETTLIDLPTDTSSFLVVSSNAIRESNFVNAPHLSNHTVITGNNTYAPRPLQTYSAAWDPARYTGVLAHYQDAAQQSLWLSDGVDFHPVVGLSNTGIYYGVDHVFTSLELISRKRFGNNTGGSSTPIIYDIETNAKVGAEIHIQRRDATQPITIDIGARRFLDLQNNLRTATSAKLTLTAQYSEVRLRRLDTHWAIITSYLGVDMGQMEALSSTMAPAEVWVSAEPTTGTWAAGTRFYMRTPAAGAVAAWIMTTTGDLAGAGVKKVLQTVPA